MAKIEKDIVVDVPVSVAYNQWTQFEEFPTFMDGVEEVRQLDDTHLQWVASVGGKRNEWKAEITEQKPDQRVAWRSTDGKTNKGEVSFRPADAGSRTEVTVVMGWEPEGVKETIGGALGFDKRQVKKDLDRLESLLDERGGQETGAWRGEQR